MFTVDGIAWSVPCDITRKPDIKASDISGLMMNGVQFWDIIGTYMNYEITLVPNPHSMGDYYGLYEVLTEPVASHTFALPYNEGSVELEARVENLRDVYVRLPNGGRYWKGVRFNVTAVTPTKQPTLAAAIARGLPALPPVYTADIGDTYTMTADGWEKSDSLPDLDLVAF